MPTKRDRVVAASRALSSAVDNLSFARPVTHVYNPLAYAWESHEKYLRFLNPKRTKVLFLGMNPGPWGMAQTGVPFGQVAAVRDWMGIKAKVAKPACEHPKRPVEGLECPRSEVSGERLWGLFQSRFSTPKKFFENHFVVNYCPLVFMEESGRNRTPDKLPASERAALDAVCDQALGEIVEAVDPEWLVGIGQYAEDCYRRVAPGRKITRILHPSPASPAANRGWAKAASEQLIKAGVWEDSLF